MRCQDWLSGARRPKLTNSAESWATLPADLLAGNNDVRPRAADRLHWSLNAVRRRSALEGRLCPASAPDAGCFNGDLLTPRLQSGCDYTLTTGRGWPKRTNWIVRGVRVAGEDVSADPRRGEGTTPRPASMRSPRGSGTPAYASASSSPVPQ